MVSCNCILYHLHMAKLYTVVVVLPEDKGKDKAIPVQAWTCPEGSRRLRIPDFKTVCTRKR